MAKSFLCRSSSCDRQPGHPSALERANGVYDLLYCTNLAPPISWQWLLRTDPGQTNLTVQRRRSQGFYRLGPPNDLAATDSLGTNFWLAFPNMVPYD